MTQPSAPDRKDAGPVAALVAMPESAGLGAACLDAALR